MHVTLKQDANRILILVTASVVIASAALSSGRALVSIGVGAAFGALAGLGQVALAT